MSRVHLTLSCGCIVTVPKNRSHIVHCPHASTYIQNTPPIKRKKARK